MAGKTPNFFKELKNRKVYRVAMVYAITGWIIVQVADSTFPFLNLPDWMVTAVIVFVIIGFPIAVILSWAYDMSPGGLVKTSSELAESNPLPARKRKPFTSTITIVVLLALVFGQFVYGRFFRDSGTDVFSDEIREERVAVAPFNNFTGDESLDVFGYMASEWITNGLRQLDVKTSSPELLRKSRDNVGVLPGNPNKQVSLYALTGAKFVVTGSYYLQGDFLQVSSRLESTETGEIFHDFPSIKGNKSNKEELITELTEKLKGYWAVKEANLLTILNAPKYDAYAKYLDCNLTGRQCYQDALAIDSTFTLAWIGLYYASSIWADDSLMNLCAEYVTGRWDECTDFEKNYFNFVKFQDSKRYSEALDALNKCYALDPHDPRIVHESAFFYAGLNQPEKAIERLEPIFMQFEIYKDKFVEDTEFQYLLALNRTGQHEKVLDFANEYREDLDLMRRIRSGVIRATLELGDFEKFYQWIDFYRMNNMSFHPKHIAYLYNEIYPDSDTTFFSEALRADLSGMRILGSSGSWIATAGGNFNSTAYMYYLLKDYSQAEKLMTGYSEADMKDFLDTWFAESFPDYSQIWIYGFLGAIYARQGKIEEALAQIELLENWHPELREFYGRKGRGLIPYWQARIYAILGEREKAVTALEQSMEEGRISEHENFFHDWDLASLRDYEPYLELMNIQ